MAKAFKSDSRRGLAQPFIYSGVRLGLTNTQIYNQLRAGGLSYDRTAYSKDMARLRRGPLPRRVPLFSLTHRTNISGFPPTLISRGKPRYKYNFEARTRDSRGRFNGGIVRWSFTSPMLVIPDIAAGIGIAIAPNVMMERYASDLPSDTMQISASDVYAYTEPEYLATE